MPEYIEWKGIKIIDRRLLDEAKSMKPLMVHLVIAVSFTYILLFASNIFVDGFSFTRGLEDSIQGVIIAFSYVPFLLVFAFLDPVVFCGLLGIILFFFLAVKYKAHWFSYIFSTLSFLLETLLANGLSGT
ncbi:MAG: hypothetical protein H6860_04400 [Rhodospirillales bacterium]|nr:hypothetical protein [Rhodospirillales bacterium]